MANLTTRSLTASTVSTANLNKGSALTISEMDSNFLNLNTAKLENTTDTFTGDLTISGTVSSAVGSVILNEATDNGTNSITIKAPASFSSNLTLVLPADAGGAGYGLITDGAGNLSWSESSGDITEVIAGDGLTGGAASGSATLNVVGGTGITANANDIAIDTAVTVDISTAQTLTNKSIDADNNTITNLEVDNLKSGVLDTDITAVSASDDTLASAKAIKTYVDAEVPDTTDDLAEGSTNVYYTDTRFDTRLATKTTDNLTEGSTNLYYTDTRADNRISLASINDLADVDTTGVANGKILKYNSTTSKFEIADDVDTEDDLSNNDTDDLAEGSTNLYYTDARFDTRLATKSTTDISEGTNLYYTDARADARVNLQTGANLDLSSKSTTDLSEGTNLYYTDGRFDTRLATKSTTDISEGTNLYYTDARARAVSIENVVEDTTPQLGGDLDVNGNDIVSVSNGDITIAPNGTGDIKLQKDVLIQGGATDGRYLVVDNFDGATPVTFGYNSPGITIASKGTGDNRDFPGMILHCSSSSSSGYPSIWIQRNKNDDPGTTGYLADNERVFSFYGSADRGGFYYNQMAGIEYRSSEAHSASAQGGKIEFYTMPNGTNSYGGQTKKMTIDDNIEADAPFVLKSYTTTERNSLTAVAGMMIFNTTDSKAQVYDGSAWQNLH